MIILIVNVNRSTLAQGLIHLFLSHLNTNVVQELYFQGCADCSTIDRKLLYNLISDSRTLR